MDEEYEGVVHDLGLANPSRVTGGGIGVPDLYVKHSCPQKVMFFSFRRNFKYYLSMRGCIELRIFAVAFSGTSPPSTIRVPITPHEDGAVHSVLVVSRPVDVQIRIDPLLL